MKPNEKKHKKKGKKGGKASAKRHKIVVEDRQSWHKGADSRK